MKRKLEHIDAEGEAKPLKGHPKTSLSIDGDTFRIVTGCYERVLHGYDAKVLDNVQLLIVLDTKRRQKSVLFQPVFLFSAHLGPVRCIATNGRYLATGGSDEIIKLYDLKRRKDFGSLISHSGAISSISFLLQGYMLSTSEDGKIVIWSTKNWEAQKILTGHKGTVNDFAIHPSGKLALSVGRDRSLRLWNMMTGRKAGAQKLGYEGIRVRWNTDGKKFAIMSVGKVGVYDMELQNVVEIEINSRLHWMEYYSHINHREVILVACEDKSVKMYSSYNGEILCEFSGHSSRVKSFSTVRVCEMDLLVAVTSSGDITIWDINTQTILGKHETYARLACLCVTNPTEDIYPIGTDKKVKGG